MLISATIDNVLSYDAPVTFSMRAGKITRQHMDHVVKISGLSILRGAIIYGPNASGKSNFFGAIGILLAMLRSDNCRIALQCRYKSAQRSRRYMAWEIVFSNGDAVYRYFVKTDGLMIAEETLDLYGNDGLENIFSRQRLSVKFGVGFKDDWYANRSFRSNGFLLAKFLSDGIADRVDSIDGSQKIFQAISALLDIHVIGPQSIPRDRSLGKLLKIQEFKEFLEGLLKVADLGIDGVSWRECSRREANMIIAKVYADSMPPDGDDTRFKEFRDSMWMVTTKDSKTTVYELRFMHKGVAFRIGEESDGTVRLFHLSVFLFSLMHSDSVWMVDEIDCHMHPFLSFYLLQKFLAAKGSSAQLIVSAHDTNLMTHDIWRTDEVWFAEKRVDGSSDLYSLYQFTPRFDKNLQKGYLQGMYGAIPHLGGEMLYGKKKS